MESLDVGQWEGHKGPLRISGELLATKMHQIWYTWSGGSVIQGRSS